jgi:8-oxo-dGTP pyrophosphatase MutT (NUDIX family)
VPKRNLPPKRFWGRSGAGILFHCTGDDTYLLVLRSAQVEQPGTLGIPGGACGKEGMFTGKEGKQIGEAQAWGCAMRETKEELSWWPKSKQVVSVVLFKKANFQYQTFIVDIPASEKAEAARAIQLNWENDEFIWMSIPEMVEAHEQLHFGMQHVLEQIGG